MNTDDPQNGPRPQPAEPAAPTPPPPPPLVPDYFNPTPPKLATLCRMRPVEADMAKARLGAESIDCFLSGRQTAATHPFAFNEVTLLVHEADLETARELLNRPPADATDDEYVDEPWRCPRCHRRTVDLLPLTGFWRAARVACAGLVLLPFVPPVIGVFFGDRARRPLDRVAGELLLPWLVILAALGVSLVLIKRHKRCRECGHEWRSS